MIGIDLRSTLDQDTTIHGLKVDEDTIRSVFQEIMAIDLDDHVRFSLDSIHRIREGGPYEDYRLLLCATFFTVKVMVKIDVTTGDAVIPREIEYATSCRRHLPGRQPVWSSRRNRTPCSLAQL